MQMPMISREMVCRNSEGCQRVGNAFEEVELTAAGHNAVAQDGDDSRQIS